MSGGLSDEDVEVQARALADRLDQSRAVLERAREIRVERGTWPPRDTPPAPVAVVSVLTVLKDVKAGLERLQSGFEGVKARLDLVFREGDSGAGREVGVLGGAGDLREGLADGRAVGEGIAAAWGEAVWYDGAVLGPARCEVCGGVWPCASARLARAAGAGGCAS